MDRRLLRYYNRELQHVREVAAEFAREFPKIAGRLSLDGLACADPYVERLLEGFAFLAARVQLKLDAEFPRFTQSMLDTIYPHYLTPTPSMAIVRFQPDLADTALAEGFVVPRGTTLRGRLGRGEQTACQYRTAHDVRLLPLRVVQAGYYSRELASLEIPRYLDARAGIHVRLECTAGVTLKEMQPGRLTFFLGSDAVSGRLYEQIFGHAVGLVIQSTARPVRWQQVLGPEAIHRVGFSNDEALLPYDARSFHGYRLLHEYFALPARYMFVGIDGLDDAAGGRDETAVDLVILLDEPDLELQSMVDASRFQLFCTPAINLFPKRADRIHLSESRSEFHVVPDRTRPLDFEVYQVLSVTGYGKRADEEMEFRPFYAAKDAELGGAGGGAYFTVHRVPRTASQKERLYGRRSSYAGSEVFLSLVDAHAAPFSSDLRQLGVETLCTNRDLPLHMAVGQEQGDFTADISAPIEDIRCIVGPTPPRPAHAEGDIAWRAVSHLSLNYLSLLDTDQQQGAAALRELLRLYGDASDPAVRKQIEGLKSVTYRPVT
ncbi:MAG: type VI secretion system baseplate subunit TssF, partial [Planctomycetes bacterium]|nr:type VI secretion system baseplate subunit TssF [Planctomycetota bacterium]